MESKNGFFGNDKNKQGFGSKIQTGDCGLQTGNEKSKNRFPLHSGVSTIDSFD